MNKPFFILSIAALATALAACGGGHKSQSTAAASPAAAVSPAAGVMAAQGAQPAGSAAPVPATLHCSDGQPVWANPRRHVFHVAADPYYGRTKHGEYMCLQQATQQGYHQAHSGTQMRHSSGQNGSYRVPVSPTP